MSARSFLACVVCAAVTPMAHADIEFFDFNLSGMQEVPAVNTPAFGYATLEFDTTAMTFDLDLFVEGISLDSITGAHIHWGAFGTNGPIVVDLLDLSEFLDAGGDVGFFSATNVPLGGAFTPEQLRGSLLYVNVHTTGNPGGEIRGQVPAPGALVVAGVGAMMVGRRRRR